MLTFATILCAIALLARTDKFGRKKSSRGRGRPQKVRRCGCPTRQHRADCHHAFTTGKTHTILDAERERLEAEARAAVVAERNRLARAAHIASLNLGPWVPLHVAQMRYRDIGTQHISATCIVCTEPTRYAVSLRDLSRIDELVPLLPRVVCASCSTDIVSEHSD